MTSPAAPPGRDRLFAVLLAGGKGTRFWPGSRAANPKQFLKLAGDRSLLRMTWERFARLVPAERILVVTGSAYADRTRAELPELPAANLVIEPSGRDTAPAAALGALAASERHPDPVLVIAPTDHYIRDEMAFLSALGRAAAAAAGGSLVTMGIVPDRPATTYGYIHVAAGSPGSTGVLPVLAFVEKPRADTAARLLAAGDHYWNAGIFIWTARAFNAQLEQVNPSLWRAFAEAAALFPAREGRRVEFDAAWGRVPAVSIDYALMEKAAGVALVPLDAGWSDVGSWDAVRELLAADPEGNRPAKDVLYIGARDCSVHREGEESASSNAAPDGESAAGGRPRLYALVGVEDLIVVETPDAVLICRKNAGESMRDVVRRLTESGRTDLL